MKNLENNNNIYLVIESFKGNEEIVFEGTQEECQKVEDELRAELIREQGDDITTIKDYYTVSNLERGTKQERLALMNEYKDSLTEEELKERVIIDGKEYMKWVIDFNNMYK